MPTTLAKLRRRAEKAREPSVTCPASRNLHLWADLLATGSVPGLLCTDPKHCAMDMLAVLSELWERRAMQSNGGHARAKVLSAKRIVEIARKAAKARWSRRAKIPRSKARKSLRARSVKA